MGVAKMKLNIVVIILVFSYSKGKPTINSEVGFQTGLCHENQYCDTRYNFMACGGSGTCMSIGGWGAMRGLGICKCGKEEPSTKCQLGKPCRYGDECGNLENQGY